MKLTIDPVLTGMIVLGAAYGIGRNHEQSHKEKQGLASDVYGLKREAEDLKREYKELKRFLETELRQLQAEFSRNQK